MTLAQVVYQMSNDRDFAAQLFSNPEDVLEQRNLQISKEELAFLLSAGRNQTQDRIVALADIKGRSWAQ